MALSSDELERVRRDLDELAEARLLGPWTSRQQAAYDGLIYEESALLAFAALDRDDPPGS